MSMELDKDCVISALRHRVGFGERFNQVSVFEEVVVFKTSDKNLPIDARGEFFSVACRQKSHRFSTCLHKHELHMKFKTLRRFDATYKELIKTQ